MKKLKKFLKNKTAVTTIFYIACIALSEYLRVYVPQKTHYDGYRQMFALIEIVFALLTVKNIIQAIRDPLDRSGGKINTAIRNVLQRLFKPIVKVLIHRYEHRERLIYGVDERKFVMPVHILEKLKKQVDLREKINLDDCQSNNEIIRMLYVRLILGLRKDGKRVSDSWTPREVKASLNTNKDNALLDTYEAVRYDKNAVAEDELVELYKNQYNR